jgi:hypothetical protein
MYLNNVDDGATLFFDDDMNIIKYAEAKAYTCVASSPMLHAHNYAKGANYRIVVVFTWNS